MLYRRTISGCSATPPEITTSFFVKSKTEAAKELMKERVPNERKRVLRALPDSIYFSFPIKRQVTKERLMVKGGVEPPTYGL